MSLENEGIERLAKAHAHGVHLGLVWDEMKALSDTSTSEDLMFGHFVATVLGVREAHQIDPDRLRALMVLYSKALEDATALLEEGARWDDYLSK